ncbi:MAG: hypothetical protein IMY72_13835 [Bacteroidetes bacterium]|nr:hypothetical protein [Bacteroidota bacterium]
MKNLLLIILSIIFSISIEAQNVGQKGGVIKNYVDINGDKQGFWQKKHYNGKLKYEGAFKNNKPVGELKRYNDKGELISIQTFLEKNKQSSVTFYDKFGKVESTGFFYNKEKDSVWSYYEKDSVLILQENFIKGQKNGLTTCYFQNGNVCEIANWKDGIKNGENKQYFLNGKLRMQKEYKNGISEGEFASYNDAGIKIIQGEYKNDYREGKWVFYDEKGKFKEEVNYEKGIADKQEELINNETIELNSFEKNKGKFKEPSEELDKMYDN